MSEWWCPSAGDIRLPPRVQDAMQMQVEAERRKRAAILESEGMREAEVSFYTHLCILVGNSLCLQLIKFELF